LLKSTFWRTFRILNAIIFSRRVIAITRQPALATTR
jgi:hypothetical protein